MVHIKKKLVVWEIKHGAIFLGGRDYDKNIDVLSDFVDGSFELETPIGNFSNKNLYHKPSDRFLRISCRPFITSLKEGEVVYVIPINKNNLKLSKEKPKIRSSKVSKDRIESLLDYGLELDKKRTFLITIMGKETNKNFDNGIKKGVWGFWTDSSVATRFIKDGDYLKRPERLDIKKIMKKGDQIIFLKDLEKKPEVVQRFFFDDSDYFKGFPRLNFGKLVNCVFKEVWLTHVNQGPYDKEFFKGFETTINIEPQEKAILKNLDLFNLSELLRRKISYNIVSFQKQSRVVSSLLKQEEVNKIITMRVDEEILFDESSLIKSKNYEMGIVRLKQELKKSCIGSEKPEIFELNVKSFFELLGFRTQHYGGSGKTDVKLNADIGKDSYTIVVDVKSSKNFRVQEAHINWDSILDHKINEKADYAILVGPEFAGGNLEKRAIQKKILLLNLENLCNMLEIMTIFPLTLLDWKLLFINSETSIEEKINELKQIAFSKKKYWEDVGKIFLGIFENQAEYKNKALTLGNLETFFLKKIEPEQIKEVLGLLSSENLSVLDDSAEGFLTSCHPKTFEVILKRIVEIITSLLPDK